jgi:hypothetical protein
MTLRLVSLRAEESGACLAEFVRGEEHVTARFEVDERGGITTASPEPDVFAQFDGTAEDLRRIVGVILEFCRLSTPP